MTLTCLIPNIFYEDASVGLYLFRDVLRFEVVYEDKSEPDKPLYILTKDTLKIHLHQSPEFARKDRPEIRIQTDDIEALYADIKTNHPGILHPNGNVIKDQPWGLREFALRDASDVCIILQQILQ